MSQGTNKTDKRKAEEVHQSPAKKAKGTTSDVIVNHKFEELIVTL